MTKKAYSKRIRNKGMKALHACYLESARNTGISPNALYDNGLPKKVDVAQLMKVLHGLGYVQYKLDAAGGIHMAQLTEKGICYFEQLHDDRIHLAIHSIILPIIVSLVTTMLTGLISTSSRRNESSYKELPVERPTQIVTSTPSPSLEFKDGEYEKDGRANKMSISMS